MITTYRFTFATTGGAGASASPALTSPYGANVSTRPISGAVKWVYVKYNTQAATTDLEVKTLGLNAPAQSILTLTNKNTDGYFYPRVAVTDTSGVAALFASGGTAIVDCLTVDDYICVTVAQGNDKTMDVWIAVEC